jgi:hypothetical protein
VRSEGVGILKKFNALIGTGTRNLLGGSIKPHPSTLPHAPKNEEWEAQTEVECQEDRHSMKGFPQDS